VNAIAVELCDIDIRSALELASRKDIYAYDASFIECALRMGVPLLTLDRRLSLVAKETGIVILE
jgi:predicted nucleic acid-binding protein